MNQKQGEEGMDAKQQAKLTAVVEKIYNLAANQLL